MRFLFILLFLFACSAKDSEQFDQIVEASCGQCMFAMDDFGDAHAEDGFCNFIRKAKVKGHVEESIFVVSSFELLSDAPSPES